ncbi:MAG: M28 family peptidase [Pseudohongiellaceae bacterium]
MTRSRFLTPGICAVLAAALTAVVPTVLSQTSSPQSDQSPWFGLPLPPGIGDPHQPTVAAEEASPAPAEYPAEEAGYTTLQGERIYPLVDEIIGFSRQSRAQGNRVWGRVTGFPSLEATIEWTAQQFRDAGLSSVEVHEYDGEGEFWWPRDWEVRLLGDARFGTDSDDVVLESSLVTSGSDIPDGTLTASLVYTGHITEALPDTDVRGKIAVQHLTPNTGAYSERTPTRERARQLMARGAVAVINVVEQTGNMHTRDFSNCNGPCFNVGTADGEFLEAAIAAAAERGLADALRVRLSLDAENLTGLEGQNAVGIVQGSGDGNVVINAHADGWYDAAGDNADGLAVLIAMARHFAMPENRPDRTLVFVATGGHHSTGLNGPANFVADYPGILADTVLVLNLEHIAQFEITSGDWTVGPHEQPMSFSITNSAPFLVNLMREGVERYGFNLNEQFRTNAPGDLGGYRPLELPMVQAIHSGPMYHASGDVLGTISVPGLERAARFYTWFVDEVASAEREQIDPR